MSSEVAFREKTTQLLRPRQVEEMREEAGRMEKMLSAPPHISGRLQDSGEVTRQLRRLKQQIETQAPHPYAPHETDLARKREAELAEMIASDMPTHDEMMRNPTGAVDRHRRWEGKHKAHILEWKNIRLRRHQSGEIDLPTDSCDIANVEILRPASGHSGELNMDRAQIGRKIDHHMPPGIVPHSTVMSDAQSETLKSLDPDLHGKMALLTAEQRAQVLAIVDQQLAGKGDAKKRGPSEYNLLQKRAAELGINAFGMKADALKAAVAEAEAKAQEG